MADASRSRIFVATGDKAEARADAFKREVFGGMGDSAEKVLALLADERFGEWV